MGPPKSSTINEILDLINPAPSADPEDDNDPDTVAKVVERFQESEESDADFENYKNKQSTTLDEDDERYIGKKVSRKSFSVEADSDQESEELSSQEESSDDDEEGSDSDEEEDEDDEEEDEDDEEEDEDDEEEDEDDEEGESHGGEDLEDDQLVEDENSDTFQHMSNKNIENEIEKGSAVRNQLKLWDKLLECRIQLQKCVIPANKLPQAGKYEEFASEGGQEFQSAVKHTKKSVSNLLEKLLELQSKLVENYSETKLLCRSVKEKKQKLDNDSDEEIPSSTEEEEEDEAEEEMSDSEQKLKEVSKSKLKIRTLCDYADLLRDKHKMYEEYRNATIQKWNDKTKIAVGHLSSKNFSAFEQSTLKQIEQILSNRERLIRRTQLKRSAYEILGAEPTVKKEKIESICEERNEEIEDRSKEYNTEIFDDTDFYHQLLRELIERKSSDITDPIQLGKQWVELQKLRSKMKRKVDTRATKGRKIRYVVHPKLVNFMAPIPDIRWTDEAKNELYNSLFGKKS